MSRRTASRPGLVGRMVLVYGLTSLVVVTLLGAGVYWLSARFLTDQAEQNVAALADFYAAYTAATAPDEERLAAIAPEIVRFFAPQADYEVRLFDGHTGSLLAATRDTSPLPSGAALAELGQRRPTLFLPASYDEPDRLYAARQGRTEDSTLLFVVEVSRGIGEMQAFLGTLRSILVAASALALLVAWVASLLLARAVTRPLREMEQATQAIAAGDLDLRLAVTTRDEIGSLAESINRMAADLARLEAARRDFIARISHDLRTPLTAIKGSVINLQDVAPEELQPSLATVDEQSDRLIRLVDDLLTLSRLQRGQLRLRLSDTDLCAVTRSAASLAGEKAERLGVHLSTELPATAPTITADADRLQQVVLNLVDNALRATPPGGSVEVEVGSGGEEITLTVRDDGRGPTPDEEAHAFEPYFRGPGGGAGLGLSISRDIVLAHGGRIWLIARPEGGAEAGFALPLIAQAA
jgi:signal transduction histidine kinase